VLLNEIAPRVHNSGHVTIEAGHASQFENHIRAVLGLPLGSCALRVPAATMINVLGCAPTPAQVAAAGGDAAAAGAAATWAPMQRALSVPGASLHWYDKHLPADGGAPGGGVVPPSSAIIKAGRKMGHITVTGESAMAVADRVRAILGLQEGEAVAAAASDPDASAALRALSSHAPLVGVIMGSDSDLPGMAAAAETLRDFGVPFELTIVSAHRTPQRMYEYATGARSRGIRVIIAAAGGAAHLPGMVAALTPLPVIGVPMPLHYLDGQDSLYSIVQMPRGVPVATVAIGNSTNAALLAVRMLGGCAMPHLADAMEAFQRRQEAEVLGKVDAIAAQGWDGFLKAKAAAAAAAKGK
jgi:phosphoribosylaminoimidazole carboxylase